MGLLSHDRMSESESPKITQKHFKNIMKKEHSQPWILFEERRLQRPTHWLIIIVLLIMIITLVAISPLLT
jgi:type IV secretory pathway VirD2 relaxase